MSELANIRAKCVDLLIKQRGDERYRVWAEGSVDRFISRGGNSIKSIQSRADKLLAKLQSSQKVPLVMSGGDFFSPRVIHP